MNFVKSDKKKATHVIVLDTEDNEIPVYKLHLTVGKAYELLECTAPECAGEEMIQSDKGEFILSFSVALDVEYIRYEE